MEDPYLRLQKAVFERYDDTARSSWNTLSIKYALPIIHIRRAYHRWSKAIPESQPLDPSDIHIPQSAAGRPCQLDKEEERILADAVRSYADRKLTLTPTSVRDLVQEYVNLLPLQRRTQITFQNGRPARRWLHRFIARNNLEMKSVKVIEDKRVQALTMEHVAEHIARVKSLMTRFNIRNAKYVFNLDQSGCSFERMTGRSLRKGVGSSNVALISSSVRTKGNLERVTIMPVVSANGYAYKPVVVYPGVQRHYRSVKGQRQTLHDYLPDCYLYQRKMPGVNTEIMFDWAKGFVQETKELRQGGQYLLLTLDGYAAHVQFKTLNLLMSNRILVLVLPSHLSNVLQPLDVSVFSAYKSYLQREIHSAARGKNSSSRVLDGFDIAECITNAYYESISCRNIKSGFARSGIWVPSCVGPSIEPLAHLFTNKDEQSSSTVITLQTLLKSFENRGRTLIRCADVEESGTIRVNTAGGCHLTQQAVLEALRMRDQRRKPMKKSQSLEKELSAAYKEPAVDIRRLVELAPSRAITRNKLKHSREERRRRQLQRLAVRIAFSSVNFN